MKYLLSAVAIMLAFSLKAQFITNTGIDIHNSAFVITNGDWINEAPTQITNHGVIFTHGNFINQGTLDRGSKGGFTLRSDQSQIFQPGGSRFGYFTKEQSGDLTVIGSFIVSDSLRIKDGIVRLQNMSDTIGTTTVLADTGFYVEPGSWIEGGHVSRAGNGDNVLFPLAKDGLYLPLTLHRMHGQIVVASVTDAPSGYAAGPGVEGLVDFPYVWNVESQITTDTAAYVEIGYPSDLVSETSLIVVRQVPDDLYRSMGARLVDDSGATTTVRSYSRRLNGTFTIARGFPGDFETDSLALVALYESTGGPNWTNQSNWLAGDINTWYGVDVAGQSITRIELPANNLIGPLPDPLVDILSLQVLNVSNNEITSIPVFAENPEIVSLNVSGNALDFASLEPNASVTGINYLAQQPIGSPIDDLVEVNTPYSLTFSAGGTESTYTWLHNGKEIQDAEGPTYVVESVNRQTMGQYAVEVTNPLLPGLTLHSHPATVLAWAEVSGQLLADPETPVSQGQVTLYRVQPGAFDPVSTIDLEADGSWRFEKVVLDDYQIRALADTLVHTDALPTYYRSTIFWEEADTLAVENHITALDIHSHFKPGPPAGRGSITGIFYEEVDVEGRSKLKELKPIAKAGVSVRRVLRTGRPKDEKLELVAYGYTDDRGEFRLPNLPEGEYRINFQYPGYPMNDDSYTTVFIGSALESQVIVEAKVQEGKIWVEKMNITGIYEASNYSAEVFPNPAADVIHLKFAGAVEGRYVTIADIAGRTLHVLSATEVDSNINVSNWPAGIYLVTVYESGMLVKTLRVAIEN